MGMLWTHRYRLLQRMVWRWPPVSVVVDHLTEGDMTALDGRCIGTGSGR
jgi:hypothetical protein